MSDIAIRVENLSKRYRIGLKEEIHDTIVSAMVDFISQPIKNLRRLRQLSHFEENGHDPEDIIWALKDVSFEVKRGEVVGIIGRNGAGKTTLLKILSHITEPTSGRAEISGRVASLLAVGTGFHSELTGRENVYLNGTILGMKKTEVDRKFDEIVDFSGVEKFIDTPVKRYSSGMYVRLAFAVAAHLEPEILLVDEVLAVGDYVFRQKCLGKMGEVSQLGRTILFVSHDMSQIRRLCERAIWLDQGIIREIGDAKAVSLQYEREAKPIQGVSDGIFVRKGVHHPELWVEQVELSDQDGHRKVEFEFGDTVILTFFLRASPNCTIDNFHLLWTLKDEGDVCISTGCTEYEGVALRKSTEKVRCVFPSVPLYKGVYKVEIGLYYEGLGRIDTWSDQVYLEVLHCSPFKSGYEMDRRSGHVALPHNWDFRDSILR